MANFTIEGNDTSTAATTILYFVNHATTLHRLKLFEVFVASDASADSSYSGFIRRITAENGTPGGTAVTPRPNDPADAAADSNAVEAPTGEPTYTATSTMIMTGGHQRSSFLWAPAAGREIIVPATADNGLGHEIQVSATAYNMVMHMRYSE
jgi:hypothetical protein